MYLSLPGIALENTTLTSVELERPTFGFKVSCLTH